MTQQETQQVQPQFTYEGGHLVMFHQPANAPSLVKDPTVNDHDRLIDILTTEKHLMEFYQHPM